MFVAITFEFGASSFHAKPINFSLYTHIVCTND